MLWGLWHLSRPSIGCFVLLLVICGYGWAHWDRALPLTGGGPLLWTLAAWAALHVGTMWLNAALDRDEGELLFGKSVPPPPWIGRLGLVALLLAGMLSTMAGGVVALCMALSIGLSVAYSYPSLAWKGHPLGGPFVNLVGYGLLSPFVGWSVVGVSMNSRTLVVWGLGVLGIFGVYLAAQAFQGEEDRARGYRTFVVTWGGARTVGLARRFVGGALWGAALLAAVGWVPRLCLVMIPAILWTDSSFPPWNAADGGTELHARRMATRLVWTGFIGFIAATGVYLSDSLAGRPVAGLGTAGGHPPQRVIGFLEQEKK